MIYTLLQTLTEQLNDFLLSYYRRAENIVEVGMVEANPEEEQTDKIIVTLLNIERETAMGISTSYKQTSGAELSRQSPPWHLNLDILIAAVFSSKSYSESLKVLSDSISFLQQNNCLRLPDGQTVTLEPVTLSWQELSNIWSVFGGHYYPSIICKTRMLTFDGSEIKDMNRRITQQSVQ